MADQTFPKLVSETISRMDMVDEKPEIQPELNL